MRALEEVTGVPLSLSPVSNSPVEVGNNGSRFSGWLFDCHGFWYNVALILPSFLFVVYLALQARKSLTKLSYGRSHIMIAYYGLLWLVSVLNLAWCCLQVRNHVLSKFCLCNIGFNSIEFDSSLMVLYHLT
uniref:Uncharacterized protein n=1 Tax=Nelumbo nucifera TaxID=4432 RepID=A0A822YUD1_NELNU|nr:TPA_asm: hypothetical protein HUJ06_005669 [Nelumbo nucifera]